MPSPLERIETAARKRREAVERVKVAQARAASSTERFAAEVERARSDHNMEAIAEAADMSRANLYKLLGR